ncbi:MAG: hypothetical protein WD716_12925 [Fimbriimonadaceae bacterium]
MLALPVFSMDLTVLRTPNEVLERAKEFLKSTPMAPTLYQMVMPGTFAHEAGFASALADFIIVPVVPELENVARRMIERPESLVPPIEIPPMTSTERRKNLAINHAFDVAMFRKEGIGALGHFKSTQNIALLESQFADTAVWGYTRHGDHGDESGYEYIVRRVAYEVLTAWGVNVDKPVIEAPKPGP